MHIHVQFVISNLGIIMQVILYIRIQIQFVRTVYVSTITAPAHRGSHVVWHKLYNRLVSGFSLTLPVT